MQNKTLNLPDIKEVKPFSSEDMGCLNEIKAVLEKHNATSRFGLHLLHSHFELENDEVLVEDTDEINRIQTISPIKKSEIPQNAMYTNWRFDTHNMTSPVCRISNKYHN